MNRAIAVLAIMVAALSLAGCGRKGSPRPPPDAIYPMVYPARARDDAGTLEPSIGVTPSGQAVPLDAYAPKPAPVPSATGPTGQPAQ